MPSNHSCLKKVLGKFIKPQIIAEAIKSCSLVSIYNKDVSSQVTDDELVIVYVTKQKVKKLLNDGDISQHKYKLFYEAARNFLVVATEYLLAWSPVQDELLCHATWIDFNCRLEKRFSSVEYSVHKICT